MEDFSRALTASTAARLLGVSAKALRVYERAGLVTPARNSQGYRVYGQNALHEAARVIEFRRIGFALTQIAQLFSKSPDRNRMWDSMTSHEKTLIKEMQNLARQLDGTRYLRLVLSTLPRPHAIDEGYLDTKEAEKAAGLGSVTFPLPSPWVGQVFTLPDMRGLNYIVGSRGSGKTQLAVHLHLALPRSCYLSLNRLQNGGLSRAGLSKILKTNSAMGSRICELLAELADDGATESDALRALIYGIEVAATEEGASCLVVDAVEQDLDRRTQEALRRFLRRRAEAGSLSTVLVTRSSAILDLATVGPDEGIILCPPNHSPPISVAPQHRTFGYETLGMCLVSPED